MKTPFVLAALLGVSACSTPPDKIAPPAPEPTAGAEPVADTCGAQGLQSLIGKPRSAAPVPVKPQLQRVLCTTCAMTMDYRAERVNILFDAKTGLIKEVRCG